MPYPGKLIARTRTCDGQWSKMDEDYFSTINLVVPSLLAPDNLVVKKVNGVEMTSQSFNQLLQAPDESVVVSTTDQYLLSVVEKYIQKHNEKLQLRI